MMTLGQVASLQVKRNWKNRRLSWLGAGKRSVLPYKEQTEKIRIGKSYPVALYIDKKQTPLCDDEDL